MGVWQGVAIVFQKFCLGSAKPCPPYALCTVVTVLWVATANVFGPWMVSLALRFFLLLGVGQRLPHALGTARAKTFRLDCGLKSVVVRTKYDLPKVTFFSQKCDVSDPHQVADRSGFFTQSFCLPFVLSFRRIKVQVVTSLGVS